MYMESIYRKLYIFQMLMDWNGQAFTRGGMAVDTFFVMGGLLVSLSLLRELKRNNGRFNVFSFYFHRFLRFRFIL